MKLFLYKHLKKNGICDTIYMVVAVLSVLLIAAGVCMAVKSPASPETDSVILDSSSEYGLVNINTATADELMSLPRIGTVMAQRIVEYRDKNGGFKDVNELINIRGIGKGTLGLLRNRVCV